MIPLFNSALHTLQSVSFQKYKGFKRQRVKVLTSATGEDTMELNTAWDPGLNWVQRYSVSHTVNEMCSTL